MTQEEKTSLKNVKNQNMLFAEMQPLFIKWFIWQILERIQWGLLKFTNMAPH